MNRTVTGRAHSHFAAAMLRLGRFVMHFMEMCMVMCIGGLAILTGLFFLVAAQLGYADLRHQAPGLTLGVVAFNLALAMVVWMRIRRHEWRPTFEMAAPTVALAVLVFGLAVLGVMALPDVGTFCGIACALMLVPMLSRLDMYSGAHHHEHAVAAAHHA